MLSLHGYRSFNSIITQCSIHRNVLYTSIRYKPGYFSRRKQKKSFKLWDNTIEEFKRLDQLKSDNIKERRLNPERKKPQIQEITAVPTCTMIENTTKNISTNNDLLSNIKSSQSNEIITTETIQTQSMSMPNSELEM